MGTLSLFLNGFWDYDGSGGLKKNMYIKQFFYDILAFYSSPEIVTVVAPISLFCCFLAVAYIIIKNKLHFNNSILYVFLIITILNTILYTFAFLIYHTNFLEI
jgi:hypothetical protein